ncbi:hypothetical protein EDB84DRAFT_1442383 [Lactarius hengduanensis]|nr:hypothetical protein EDB84DRAFT_1442383 [Lactarius hengduanensis]
MVPSSSSLPWSFFFFFGLLRASETINVSSRGSKQRYKLSPKDVEDADLFVLLQAVNYSPKRASQAPGWSNLRGRPTEYGSRIDGVATRPVSQLEHRNSGDIVGGHQSKAGASVLAWEKQVCEC